MTTREPGPKPRRRHRRRRGRAVARCPPACSRTDTDSQCERLCQPSATPSPTATGTAAPDRLLVQRRDLYTPQALALLDCSDPAARRSVVRRRADEADRRLLRRTAARSTSLDVAKVVGKDVKTATAGTDQRLGEWQVNVKFTGKGQNKLTDLTSCDGRRSELRHHARRRRHLGADHPGAVINGDAQITGNFTQKTRPTSPTS